jgi:ribosomal protein S18 acetylase RimI-like enzyme
MIRPFRAGDEPALYEVCLRTAASGEDATGHYDDPDLLGHVYVGPYLRLEPGFARVLADDDGPAGYVIGTPDTRAFEARCEHVWWPPLRRQYPPESYDEGNRDYRLVRLLYTPHTPPDDVVAEHPAHLHIDLLPRAQGQGHGRRLMTALLDRFRAAGAAGVHLGVSRANPRAIAFYDKLGFAPVADTSTGGILMARRL